MTIFSSLLQFDEFVKVFESAGWLSKKAHIPPLKISGIKNRYNAVDETFYDAITA